MTRSFRLRDRPLLSLMAVLLLIPAFGSVQLSGRAAPSAAQDAAPSGPSAGDGVDLAAIVVDAADLPDGAGLLSEHYLPVEEIIDLVSGDERGELEAAGLLGYYRSTYSLPDSRLTVRSYAAEYADEDGAASGFAILQDETGSYPLGTSDDSGIPGIVGDDEEITTVDADYGGGYRFQSIDATVRFGRIVAGAAIESEWGTAEPDLDTVIDLIEVVADRVETTLDGDRIAGRDASLPAALLQPGSSEDVLIEGHLAPSEVLPNELDDLREGVEGGFARTTGIRFQRTPTAPHVLFVGLFHAAFSGDEEAEQALYALDNLPLPSLLPPPADSFRQQATTAAISGVDAFAESWRAFLPGGPIDSTRLGFVLGSRLVVVEVAGAANLNAAHDAAVLIAELQRDCLEEGERCAEVLPVEEIQGLALIEAEPIEPIEDADPDRQATFDAVWNEVNDDYLYRTGRQNVLFPNYHELDWGAVREEYERAALEAETDEEFYQTIAAMVDELGDQHTRFLSPEDSEINAALFAGELYYAGIGVDLAGADLILHVFPDSPAERAGLQRRDRIEAVNGDPLPVDDLVALGEVVESVNQLLSRDQLPDDPGGPITLTVRSPGEEPREVEVERDTGEAPIVPAGMRLPQDDGIGYLVIPDFVTPDLQERVVEILEEMLDEGDLDGLVLDLRANPGGSVALLETFLGLFVEGDAGAFYYRDGRLPEPIRIERQAFAGELDDVPLVVLADDRMYSASEVATAILQSQGRATVVGVTSPGDVEVLLQSYYGDESSLFLVRGIFVLPGALVEGIGNIPDIPVLLDWTDYSFDDDPQILAAVNALRAGEART